MTEKLCTKCGINPAKPRKSWCLGCIAEHMRAWRKTSAGKRYKESMRIQRYGLTIEEYDELYRTQQGQCAICATPEAETEGNRLVIDHCHDQGHVRGLLCQKCNRAIGCLNDDPQLLEAALEYLQ